MANLNTKRLSVLIKDLTHFLQAVEEEQEKVPKQITVEYEIAHPWGTGIIQLTHEQGISHEKACSYMEDIFQEIEANSIYIKAEKQV